MSIFAAWSNGNTPSISSIGGSFAAAASPASCAGSQAGRQGGGMFGSAQQSAPMRGQGPPASAMPLGAAAIQAGGPPPPPPMGTTSFQEEEMYQQKSAPPPMCQAAPMQQGPGGRSRAGSLVQDPRANYSRNGSMAASEVVSPQTSPTPAQAPQQMMPPEPRRQSQAPSDVAMGRKAAPGQKAAPAPKAQPLKGTPDDMKKLLKELSVSNQTKKIAPPANNTEREVLEVPPQAEDEFEKQLKRVTGLTDVKKKADITGPLQDLNFQEPPAHIQGLALREALKEISGKKEEAQ